MNPLRLGIVGCGAVTETLHLPALKRSPGWTLAALVDADRARAARFAAPAGAAVFSSHLEFSGNIDAALVAVPNALHAQVTIDLLDSGIPVLVEKPMALSVADCDRMIAAAARSGATLAVGLGRRFFPAYRFVKRLLDEGALGPLQSFEFREGTVFKWPTVTDAPFRRDAGGGVLMDSGPHTLDLLLWWLGEAEQVACYDDAVGGVEANSEIHLTLRNGARGVVEFSRTRNFRRFYRIEGTRGYLEASADWNDPPVILEVDGRTVHRGPVTEAGVTQLTYQDAIAAELEEFAAAIREQREPAVPGAEGRRAIALIETCAQVRKPLPQPWRDGVPA